MKNNRTVSSRAKRISCLLGIEGEALDLWRFEDMRGGGSPS